MSFSRLLTPRLLLDTSAMFPPSSSIVASSLSRQLRCSTRTGGSPPPHRHVARRVMSNGAPAEPAIYGGGAQQATSAVARRVTLATLRGKHRRGEPISMVTAYDYPSGVHIDAAGFDICLVGDSAAMVAHGHDNTLPITLDLMIEHCRAVARAARRDQDVPRRRPPVRHIRVLHRTGCRFGGEGDERRRRGLDQAGRKHAVEDQRGEGHRGRRDRRHGAHRAHAAVRQRARRVPATGEDGRERRQVIEAALALQDAGCFAVVLECVPAPVAAAATSALQIPTIGIGAGPFCSGQVLVYHDLLGTFQHPLHAKVSPKFCKQYGNIGDAINRALSKYKQEVETQSFPGPSHTPYKLADTDVDAFLNALKKKGLDVAADAAADAVEYSEKEINGTPQLNKIYA